MTMVGQSIFSQYNLLINYVFSLIINHQLYFISFEYHWQDLIEKKGLVNRGLFHFLLAVIVALQISSGLQQSFFLNFLLNNYRSYFYVSYTAIEHYFVRESNSKFIQETNKL